MNPTVDRLIYYALTPASWLYSAATFVRNKLYDTGILPVRRFDVPVVCVGNISVGGTGKTPHVEYLIDQLSGTYRIGVLSRGYKRRTKGFLLANAYSNPDTIGDEPYQIYRKFGKRTKVAVCENRVKGIEQLLECDPDINLILLDDGFQHRAVNPRVNILLTDRRRPYNRDRVLPLGRLRESPHASSRADFVILTHVPEEISPLSRRTYTKNFNDLLDHQKLFFSHVHYEELEPVFPDEAKYRISLSQLTENDTVMLLTGIANPRSFINHFCQYPFAATVRHYPDHHDFARRDIEAITKDFDELKGARKLIITTEKDAVRLLNNPYFPARLKPFVFFLPIYVTVSESVDNKEFIPMLKAAIDREPLG